MSQIAAASAAATATTDVCTGAMIATTVMIASASVELPLVLAWNFYVSATTTDNGGN